MAKSRLRTALSQARRTSKRPVSKGSSKSSQVPPAHFDKAIRLVKGSRPYAFESFTQADWDEVRTYLRLEYRWLSNEQLKQQACNRRKQGAYSTKSKKSATARWVDVKTIVKEYWAGNATLEELGQKLDKLSATK
jgi:hypothetical protein